MNEDDYFTAGSIHAVAPKQVRTVGDPVRLAFEPYGRRKIGDADPDHPDYQILDARAFMSGPSKTVYLRDVSGRDLMVSNGDKFEPTINADLPEELRQDLSNCSPVLGVKASDREGGYVAVGVNVVTLIPN